MSTVLWANALLDGTVTSDQMDRYALYRHLHTLDGVWLPGAEAVALLEELLAAVQERRIRFGLLRNDHDGMVRELSESLAFARDAASRGARFNFAMVM